MRYFPLVWITNIPQDLSQEQLYEPEESPTSTCVVPTTVSTAVQHDGPRRIRRHHVLRRTCGICFVQLSSGKYGTEAGVYVKLARYIYGQFALYISLLL